MQFCINYNTSEIFHLTFHETYDNIVTLEPLEKDILDF